MSEEGMILTVYNLRGRFIPETEYDMIGASGEIFISVNVKECRANLLGYGE